MPERWTISFCLCARSDAKGITEFRTCSRVQCTAVHWAQANLVFCVRVTCFTDSAQDSESSVQTVRIYIKSNSACKRKSGNFLLNLRKASAWSWEPFKVCKNCVSFGYKWKGRQLYDSLGEAAPDRTTDAGSAVKGDPCLGNRSGAACEHQSWNASLK